MKPITLRADYTLPLWVMLLAGGLMIANGLTALGTLADAPFYARFSLPFTLWLRAFVSGSWAVVFAACIRGLLRRRQWAHTAIAPLVTVFALTNWLWLAVLARADYDQGRLSFQAITSLLLVLPLWWVSLRNRRLARKQSPQ